MRLDRLANFRRTHRNGDLRLDHAGQTVRLLGWCKRIRNLGSLVFIDLRDRWGVVQLRAEEHEVAPELLERLRAVRSEFVLAAEGVVRERESKNPNLPTGDIEVDLTALRILNTAQGRDAEFYGFFRALEAYRAALGEDTTVVLSPDSDFFRYFARAPR